MATASTRVKRRGRCEEIGVTSGGSSVRPLRCRCSGTSMTGCDGSRVGDELGITSGAITCALCRPEPGGGAVPSAGELERMPSIGWLGRAAIGAEPVRPPITGELGRACACCAEVGIDGVLRRDGMPADIGVDIEEVTAPELGGAITGELWREGMTGELRRDGAEVGIDGVLWREGMAGELGRMPRPALRCGVGGVSLGGVLEGGGTVPAAIPAGVSRAPPAAATVGSEIELGRMVAPGRRGSSVSASSASRAVW